ncbi:unnamed protein product, partial [Rotaria sp. Silwood2]
RHFQVPSSDINSCIKNKTLDPLLRLYNRSKLKRKCRIDSTKSCVAFIKEGGDVDMMSDDLFVPLLRYHTRQNVIQETDGDNEDENYEPLLNYHHEQEIPTVISPDEPILY